MRKSKIIKRILVFTVIISCVISVPVLSFAKSGTVTGSVTVTGEFSKEWPEVRQYTTYNKLDSSIKTVINYHYNTFLINEDVCDTYYTGGQHFSRIKNGAGTKEGPSKAAREWSDLEITHSGNTVTYSNVEEY